MSSHGTHRPLHCYHGGNLYFLTGSTWNRDRLFNDNLKKSLLRDCIFESADKYVVNISSWVVLENHYHVECAVADGKVVPCFIQGIHGRSSKELNDIDGIRGRKIWYQYWDSFVRGETDYWKRFNYVHQNPVKHGYCSRMEQYEFSSYHEYDRSFLDDCFEKYPIINFVVDNDG